MTKKFNKNKKGKKTKFLMLKIVFWSAVIALCFVMFFMGYLVGEFW